MSVPLVFTENAAAKVWELIQEEDQSQTLWVAVVVLPATSRERHLRSPAPLVEALPWSGSTHLTRCKL